MTAAPLAGAAPSAFHVMVKPGGAICNLDCEYCYFLSKEQLYPGSPFRLDDELLGTYTKQYIAAQTANEVTFAWQGGEPTLLGLPFFERALELQARHKRPGMTLHNTFQTNGTLLDDDWCAFFKRHEILVGLSLDGPERLHDRYRVNKGGQGSFKGVMRGLGLLKKHGVAFNVLTTVHAANAPYPAEVYCFLRDEVGAQYLQFIPIVERDNAGSKLNRATANEADDIAQAILADTSFEPQGAAPATLDALDVARNAQTRLNGIVAARRMAVSELDEAVTDGVDRRGDGRARRVARHVVGHPSPQVGVRQRPRPGADVPRHVRRLTGAGDDAGHGRVREDELQGKLRPARAAEVRREAWQGKPAQPPDERAHAEGPVDQHGDAAIRRERQQAPRRRAAVQGVVDLHEVDRLGPHDRFEVRVGGRLVVRDPDVADPPRRLPVAQRRQVGPPVHQVMHLHEVERPGPQELG